MIVTGPEDVAEDKRVEREGEQREHRPREAEKAAPVPLLDVPPRELVE